MRTLVWLGASRTLVGQFVPLPMDDMVSRVTGLPPMRTVKAAVTGLAFPMTIPDATPSMTPALSPLVMGMVVPMLWVGAQEKRTLYTADTAVAPIAMFG